MKTLLQRCFLLHREFITEREEAQLLAELSKKMKTMRWSEGHFDEKICNYRELSVSELTKFPVLSELLESRMKPLLMERPLLPLHILELRRDGMIKPHIDNHSYSGKLIAGLSLQEDSIMTLTNPANPEETVSIPLPRRSFYRQVDELRWNFEHSISMQNATNSRISVLLRDEPLKPSQD